METARRPELNPWLNLPVLMDTLANQGCLEGPLGMIGVSRAVWTRTRRAAESASVSGVAAALQLHCHDPTIPLFATLPSLRVLVEFGTGLPNPVIAEDGAVVRLVRFQPMPTRQPPVLQVHV